MEGIKIITDSHSSITQEKAKQLGITVLPMPFTINGKVYYEDINLSRKEFFQLLAEGAEVSTSQPSPADIMRVWDRELENCSEIVYIPISSGLSGSCETAQALAKEEPYTGRVFVVDNGRVATPQYRSVLDAIELSKEGYHAARIQEILEASRADMTIYIAVNTLEYLKKGGRISSATAMLGTVLDIKPILQFDVGVLHPYKKSRGFMGAKKAMLEAIHHDLENKFRQQYEAGEVYLLAATSADEETTEEWVREIRKSFPEMGVMCEPLSLAVSCHIGPNGLGIGLSCKPRRLPA